jgi:hypothetical protein
VVYMLEIRQQNVINASLINTYKGFIFRSGI